MLEDELQEFIIKHLEEHRSASIGQLAEALGESFFSIDQATDELRDKNIIDKIGVMVMLEIL
jgi:DNA-binding transcriptional ArsR family regulator